MKIKTNKILKSLIAVILAVLMIVGTTATGFAAIKNNLASTGEPSYGAFYLRGGPSGDWGTGLQFDSNGHLYIYCNANDKWEFKLYTEYYGDRWCGNTGTITDTTGTNDWWYESWNGSNSTFKATQNGYYHFYLKDKTWYADNTGKVKLVVEKVPKKTIKVDASNCSTAFSNMRLSITTGRNSGKAMNASNTSGAGSYVPKSDKWEFSSGTKSGNIFTFTVEDPWNDLTNNGFTIWSGDLSGYDTVWQTNVSHVSYDSTKEYYVLSSNHTRHGDRQSECYTTTAKNKYTISFNNNGHGGTAPASQALYEGSTVTKPTDPQEDGWVFKGWYKEQACTNAWNFSSDTVTANKTLYAKWEADTKYTVIAGSCTNGSVNVTSSPVSKETGTEVKATPATGYHFTKWVANDNGTFDNPNAATTTFHPTANATVTAEFALNTYTITWKNDDGTVIDTTEVDHGIVPTHNDPTKPSTAQYDFEFAGWSPNPVAAIKDTSYQATFTPIKKSYNVTKNETGATGGTVKINNIVIPDRLEYDTYTSNNIITPPAGYVIKSASGGGTWTINDNGASATCSSVSITGDTEISVEYVAEYTGLSADAQYTIDGETYLPLERPWVSEKVTIASASARADLGTGVSAVESYQDENKLYEFKEWYSENGTFTDSTNNETTFKPSQNSAVAYARYTVRNTHNVTVKNPQHATLTATWGDDGDLTKVPTGEIVTVTTTVDSNHKIQAVKVNGNEISGSGNTYTFSMPDEDVEITADVVELAQVTLTLKSGTDGSFKVDNATHSGSTTASAGTTKTVTVYEGDKLTFTATASSGHCTDSITIAGNTYASNTQTFTVGTSNFEASAKFQETSSNWYYQGYNINSTWLTDLKNKALCKGTYNGQTYYYYHVTSSTRSDYYQLFSITDKEKEGTRYIYFNTPTDWGNPKAHWVYKDGSTSEEYMSWYKDEYNQKKYKITIPSNVDGLWVGKGENFGGGNQTEYVTDNLSWGAFYVEHGSQQGGDGNYIMKHWASKPDDAGTNRYTEYFWASPKSDVYKREEPSRFGGNVSLYAYDANGEKAHVNKGTASDYYILMYMPNTNYGTINAEPANNNTDHIIVVASTTRPEFTFSKAQVYAKDGTVRGNFSKYAKFSNTSIVSGFVNGTKDTSPAEYEYAKVEKGSTLKIETTIESAYRSKYYVKGFVVNGKTYGVNTSPSADGKYTLNLQITEDLVKEGTLEITPVYFYINDADAITFFVTGFSDDVAKLWGNTIAAYAYYNGGKDETTTKDDSAQNALGGYPGQPMLNEGGFYYFQVPKYLNGDTNKPVTGITLNNYVWDDVHSLIKGYDDAKKKENNCQTYDFKDFVTIANKGDVNDIIFEFKYKTAGENRGHSDIPTKDDLKPLVYKNGWEKLTDYYGRSVDVYGNIIESEETEVPVYIVSKGYQGSVKDELTNQYIKDEVGNYANSWTIYRNGAKVVLTNSNTLLTIGEDSQDVNLKGVPTYITYEKSIVGGTGDGEDPGNRSDGRWYYSSAKDYITMNIKIQTASTKTATEDQWVDDPFVDPTDISSNIATNSKTSAYFTDEKAAGLTEETDLQNSKEYFNLKAVSDTSGKYTFLGWYKLNNDGTVTSFSTTSTAQIPRAGNATLIARFYNTPAGTLRVGHYNLTKAIKADSFGGMGTCTISATVLGSDQSTEVITFDDGSEALNVSGDYIYASSPNYLRITLKASDEKYRYHQSYDSAIAVIPASQSHDGEQNVTVVAGTYKISDLFDNEGNLKKSNVPFYSEFYPRVEFDYCYYDRVNAVKQDSDPTKVLSAYKIYQYDTNTGSYGVGFKPDQYKVQGLNPGIDVFNQELTWTPDSSKDWDAEKKVYTLTATQTKPVYTLTVMYQNADGSVADSATITKEFNSGAVDLDSEGINIPSQITEGGEKKDFLYWVKVNAGTPDPENILSTFRKYGYQISDNLTIKAVYGNKGEIEETFKAYIDKVEYSEEISGTKGEKDYKDTVFTDFMCRYTSPKGTIVKDLISQGGHTIKYGVVVVAKKESVDAKYILDSTEVENALKYMYSHTGCENGMVNRGRTFYNFFKSDVEHISNFNRVDFAIPWDYQTENDVLYATYSYLLIDGTYYISAVNSYSVENAHRSAQGWDN